MLRWLAVFALFGLLLAGVSSAGPNDLLVSSQSNLVYGGQVIFVGVYPTDARQKIGKQQVQNPVIQAACSQAGATVLNEPAFIVNETNNKNGTWTGTTYPLALSWSGGGAATCSASLYYWNKDPSTHALIYNFVDDVQFEVAGG